MKNENYILLKDTFDLKAGAVFEYCNPVNEAYYKNGSYFLHYSTVENNPDWFMKESDYKEKKCEEYRNKLANDIFGKKIKEWQNKQQPIETTPNKPNFDFMEYIKLVETTEKIAKMLWQSETKLSFLEGQIEGMKRNNENTEIKNNYDHESKQRFANRCMSEIEIKLLNNKEEINNLKGQIEAFKQMLPVNQVKDEHNYSGLLDKAMDKAYCDSIERWKNTKGEGYDAIKIEVPKLKHIFRYIINQKL